MDITGRHVVITGAASGIGRACARAVAESGGVVEGVDLDGCVGEVVSALPGNAHRTHLLDVTDQVALESLFADLTDVDVGGLVNSAGVVSGGSPWPATSLEQIGLVVEVNAIATARACTLFARRADDRPACIVNLSSVASLRPHPPDPTYGMTKAGVLAFTRGAAVATEGTALRVNAVLPGIVETPMLAQTGVDGPASWLRPSTERPRLTAEQVARVVVELLLGDDTGRAVIVEADPDGDGGVRRGDVET